MALERPSTKRAGTEKGRYQKGFDSKKDLVLKRAGTKKACYLTVPGTKKL